MDAECAGERQQVPVEEERWGVFDRFARELPLCPVRQREQTLLQWPWG